MNCIFCKIINKKIPSYTIYEDEIVKVFLDVNPKTCGHTLIVPKKHFKDITDIDVITLNHIHNISKNIYSLLESRLNFDGAQLIQNNGLLQEVKHYHLHIIPTYTKPKAMNINEVFELIKK